MGRIWLAFRFRPSRLAAYSSLISMEY